MIKYMVSTEDNPFNPFVQATQWQAWDEQHGYYTYPYLMRLLPYSPELDETEEFDRMFDNIVDEVIKMNLTGNYIRVKNPEYKE